MTLAPTEHVSSAFFEARGISKRFGSNRVLENVDFAVSAGQIVSVVGENGAGKSTFAKILAGITQPDDGQLRLNGKNVAFASPRDALAHRIGFIPQELAFVPTMTVAENVLLNRWPRRTGFISPKRIIGEAEKQLARMKIDVSPALLMSDIRLAEQQMIEIVKVMARDIQVLILDEPTASLSNEESDRLMAILRSLAAQGLGIVLISHRFDEVLDVSDRIDVFRNARRVFSGPPNGLTPSALVEYMLGQAVPAAHPADAALVRSGEPRLQVSGLTHEEHPQLHDVDFEVYPGEIVCLFGVRGSGVEVIAEALTGRRSTVTGSLRCNSRQIHIPSSPRAAMTNGIMSLPPDRKRQGLVLGRQIQENLTYLVPSRVSRAGFVRWRAQSAIAATWSERMRIRSRGATQAVGDLSGGNQQKVLLASRLVTGPHVLILEEPTRGVDVGARLQIHDVLRKTARDGAAILLVTPDVEEAASNSTRVLAMRFGRIVDELTGARINQRDLLHAVSGTTCVEENR